MTEGMAVHTTQDAARLFDDARLVRIADVGPYWVEALPAAPPDQVSSVALGHPTMDLVPIDTLCRLGYRLAHVATEADASGLHLDVLVTADARRQAPDWWNQLHRRASRVFDLRFGPVRRVFQAQLDCHADALLAAGDRARPNGARTDRRRSLAEHSEPRVEPGSAP